MVHEKRRPYCKVLQHFGQLRHCFVDGTQHNVPGPGEHECTMSHATTFQHNIRGVSKGKRQRAELREVREGSVADGPRVVGLGALARR